MRNPRLMHFGESFRRRRMPHGAAAATSVRGVHGLEVSMRPLPSRRARSAGAKRTRRAAAPRAPTRFSRRRRRSARASSSTSRLFMRSISSSFRSNSLAAASFARPHSKRCAENRGGVGHRLRLRPCPSAPALRSAARSVAALSARVCVVLSGCSPFLSTACSAAENRGGVGHRLRLRPCPSAPALRSAARSVAALSTRVCVVLSGCSPLLSTACSAAQSAPFCASLV